MTEDSNTPNAQTDWRHNSHFRRKVSQEKAGTYCQDRFETSARMRKLDRMEQRFASELMALAGPGAAVLDAPCGSGRFFEYFQASGELIMLDYSQAMLDEVQRRYGARRPVRLIQADITAIPLPDNSVDLCFCMRLLHHVGDDQMRLAILQELARVSRRHVAVSYYDSLSWRYLRRVIRRKKPSGHSIRLGRLAALAGKAGLSLVRKVPAVSLLEQQRMVLFEKASSQAGK